MPLQQRQRVSVGFRHDPFTHLPVHRRTWKRPEQGHGIGGFNAANQELGEPGELFVRLVCAEHQSDRVRLQPPRHEGQRLSRGAVQPVKVVDHAQQRARFGHLAQQREHGEPDQEPIRRASLSHSKGRAECMVLRLRERREVVQQWEAQLMEPREWQLHLRLDPHGAQRLKSGRGIDEPLDKRDSSRCRVLHARRAPRCAHPARCEVPGPGRASRRDGRATKRPAFPRPSRANTKRAGQFRRPPSPVGEA